MKNQRGITLISLVVTVVILIILAGVALNVTIGDNGIITKARLAKDKTEEAIQEEEGFFNIFDNMNNNNNSGNQPKEFYAVWCEDDKSLTFTSETTAPEIGGTYNSKTVTSVYKDWTNNEYSNAESIPWYEIMENIENAIIEDNVSVNSTAYWFYDADNLASVSIGNGVTKLGTNTFYGSGLSGNLEIPENVISIGNYAFDGCTNLTGTLELHDNIEYIGDGAFAHCSNLTGGLTIPDSVTTLGGYAFQECTGFNGNLVISKSISSINDGTFAGCTGFTGQIKIPDSVKSIGTFAFGACISFSSLDMGSGVKKISEGAFYNCIGLTGDLRIPNSVTEIQRTALDRKSVV